MISLSNWCRHLITCTDSHLRKSSISVFSSTTDHSTPSMRTQSDQSLTYKKPHTPSTSSSSPSTFEFLLKQKQMMETGDINVHMMAENITVLELNQSEGCTIVGDKNTYPHVTNSVKATINQDYHHHTNSLWPPSGLILKFLSVSGDKIRVHCLI